MPQYFSDEAEEIISGIRYLLEDEEGPFPIHNKLLYLQAFTHPSYANEHPEAEDNQVLEFFGDEFLDSSITRLLAGRFSGESEGRYRWFVSAYTEGGFTKLKEKLVKGPSLVESARINQLGQFIRLGKGAESLRDNPKTLEDVVEALIAAVAIDSSYPENGSDPLPDLRCVDYGKVDAFVENLLRVEKFLDRVENEGNVGEESIIQKEDLDNPKGALNKLFTKGLITKPVYGVYHHDADENNVTWWGCSCYVEGFVEQRSNDLWTSKAKAEADAASKVLDEILNLNKGL